MADTQACATLLTIVQKTLSLSLTYIFAKKYLLCCSLWWRAVKWGGRPRAHADFSGTPTYLQ